MRNIYLLILPTDERPATQHYNHLPMKMKIPKLTKAQMKKINSGEAVQLIPKPKKGYAIKMCGDGKHYEVVRLR